MTCILSELTLTYVSCIKWFVLRSVEFGLATVAIDAFSIMLALLTNTTTLVITVNIQR